MCYLPRLLMLPQSRQVEQGGEASAEMGRMGMERVGCERSLLAPSIEQWCLVMLLESASGLPTRCDAGEESSCSVLLWALVHVWPQGAEQSAWSETGRMRPILPRPPRQQ